MMSKFIDKHCDCHIEADVDERGHHGGYIAHCSLHDFAEEAAKFLNELRWTTFVSKPFRNGILLDEVEALLDNWGLLEEKEA